MHLHVKMIKTQRWPSLPLQALSEALTYLCSMKCYSFITLFYFLLQSWWFSGGDDNSFSSGGAIHQTNACRAALRKCVRTTLTKWRFQKGMQQADWGSLIRHKHIPWQNDDLIPRVRVVAQWWYDEVWLVASDDGGVGLTGEWGEIRWWDQSRLVQAPGTHACVLPASRFTNNVRTSSSVTATLTVTLSMKANLGLPPQKKKKNILYFASHLSDWNMTLHVCNH